MSSRTAAAALCLAVFFANAPGRTLSLEWMASAWSALTVILQEDDPVDLSDGGDEGWLIDPNG